MMTTGEIRTTAGTDTIVITAGKIRTTASTDTIVITTGKIRTIAGTDTITITTSGTATAVVNNENQSMAHLDHREQVFENNNTG